MRRPRCGHSEFQNLRLTNYLPWEEKQIKYAFLNFSPDLPVLEIRHAIREAFEIWSRVIPRDFIEVSSQDPSKKIEISFERARHSKDNAPFDGKGTILAHATVANLHFDEDETWKKYRTSEKYDYEMTDILSVAVHEIGHVLGLSHSRQPSAIMWSHYTPVTDSNGYYVKPRLSTDDILDIQEIYGPRSKNEDGNRERKLWYPPQQPTPPPTPLPRTTKRMPSKHQCSNQDSLKYILGSIIDIKLTEFDECCQLCQVTPGCKAFIWQKVVTGICYLKSSAQPNLMWWYGGMALILMAVFISGILILYFKKGRRNCDGKLEDENLLPQYYENVSSL